MGGHYGSGQFVVWVSSLYGYNTVSINARGKVGRVEDGDSAQQLNDAGKLHIREDKAVLSGSAEHDAIKALPNYTILDV